MQYLQLAGLLKDARHVTPDFIVDYRIPHTLASQSP